MPCFLYQYPGDPEGFRRCQERENPLGSQPWFQNLVPTPGIATPMPYAPPRMPATPSLPTPGSAPSPGSAATPDADPVCGGKTGFSAWFCRNFTSPMRKVAPGEFPTTPEIRREAGKTILDVVTAPLNWLQYPVFIVLGVAIVIIALVAIARPRVAAIVQSDIARATASVARVARR